MSHVAGYKWISAAGEAAPRPDATPPSGILQIDEIWHFVDAKKQGLVVAGLRSCGTASPNLEIGWA